MTERKSYDGWKWYGFACHHICGSRCQYHLGTNVNDLFLISTIGRLVSDPLRHPNKIDNITIGYQYETMVFLIEGEDEHGNPNKISNIEMLTRRYNDSKEAEDGHYEICHKVAETSALVGKTKSSELIKKLKKTESEEDWEAHQNAEDNLQEWFEQNFVI